MITTTYKCDKCGYEQQDTGVQMWRVDVRITHWNDSLNTTPHKDLNKLWCRTCVENVGLLPFASRPKPAEPVEIPSLEDMIRQIAQDAINAALNEH